MRDSFRLRVDNVLPDIESPRRRGLLGVTWSQLERRRSRSLEGTWTWNTIVLTLLLSIHTLYLLESFNQSFMATILNAE